MPMKPLAKQGRIRVHLTPSPERQAPPSPIDFFKVPPPTDGVLPKVHKEKDKPSRLIVVARASVADCCKQGIE